MLSESLKFYLFLDEWPVKTQDTQLALHKYIQAPTRNMEWTISME